MSGGGNGPNYTTGVWIPTVTFATPGDLSVNHTFRAATYTLIGRRCFAEASVNAALTYTTASGFINITGLPFPAAANAVAYYGVFQVSALGTYPANTIGVDAVIGSGASLVTVRAKLSVGVPVDQGTTLAPTLQSFNFRFSISYDT